MRVLYLSPGHPVHDARFARAIKAGGHEAIVAIIPSHAATSPGDAANAEATATRESRRRVVAAAIESTRPDVIHAGPLDDLTRLVAEVGGRPLLAVSWAFDLLGERAAANRDVNAWTLARSDALLVDAVAVAREARALGMPENRTVLLPWGVDVESFQPSRGEAGPTVPGRDRQTVVLMARSHEPVYGVDVGLDGFLLAAAQDPRLRLLVIGDGSMRPVLEARAAASGLGDRVRFLGGLPNGQLTAWLQTADVYLSASHVDGSSVTLLEAMACGLPAVVSDIPGNREWVVPQNTGWWFRDGSPASLADALVLAAGATSEQRSAMGQRARQVVDERADWERNRARLWEAYALAIRHALAEAATDRQPG